MNNLQFINVYSVIFANALLAQGYKIKTITPNFVKPGELVFCFEPAAQPALQQLIDVRRREKESEQA